MRRILEVARPDDWMGRLALLSMRFVGLSTFLTLAMVELPEFLQLGSRAREIALRLAAMFIAFLVMRGVSKLVFALLPGSPVLFWSTLYFRRRGRILAVPVTEIAELYVEDRPVGEMLVLRTLEGSVRDICPIMWAGAGRLHSALARKITASHRRAL